MPISNMKKFARKLLLFISFFVAFSILINSLFLGVIALTDWDFVKRLKSLRFEDPNYELLVLGSSLAEYGIDTELLTVKGVKSFNLALVGSSVKTNYVQLEEYLTKYQKRPRYVLLVTNYILEQFDQEDLQPVVDFTMKGHNYGIKDLPVSKFNWAGMELFKKVIRKQYRMTYVSYGQKKSIGVVPDNSGFKDLILDIEELQSAYWIGELARLCNTNDIELIVVEIPGVRETQNLSDLGPYTLVFENGYSAELYNFNSQAFCKFIDYENDWTGMSHFNKFGAEKFTKELFNTIKKLKPITNSSSNS